MLVRIRVEPRESKDSHKFDMGEGWRVVCVVLLEVSLPEALAQGIVELIFSPEEIESV